MFVIIHGKTKTTKFSERAELLVNIHLEACQCLTAESASV